MKIVYVAGRYSADTISEKVENIETARFWGQRIAVRANAIPFVPHTCWGLWDGLKPEEFFLEAGLEMLKKCDAIFVCPCSENSQGTQDEIKLATELELPVFIPSLMDVLVKWANK